MRNRLMFIIFTILLGFSLGLSGCAKKAAVKETTEEKAAVVEKQAPAESDADKAAREKAMREAEMREQERLRAEREKAPAAPVAVAVSPIADFAYIYFDFDKYNIKPEARENSRKLADWLNANSAYNLLIEGNCDERGTIEYNLALGERRATSALKYLATLGVDKKKMSTISYGKERPVDPGHDEAAWAKNRNDHFVVKK